MLTLSITKADTGGVVGHSSVHGPFEPHRLPLDEMEFPTMPEVSALLADRWETVEAPAVPAHLPGT